MRWQNIVAVDISNGPNLAHAAERGGRRWDEREATATKPQARRANRARSEGGCFLYRSPSGEKGLRVRFLLGQVRTAPSVSCGREIPEAENLTTLPSVAGTNGGDEMICPACSREVQFLDQRHKRFCSQTRR